MKWLIAQCHLGFLLLVPTTAADETPRPQEHATASEAGSTEDGAKAAEPEATPAKGLVERLVVTPTRREAYPFDLPYTIEVVTAADFRTRRMARTLPDAFQEMPAVLVQKTAYGQASPYIRGFTGYHNLMLIDGIRLNNSTLRSGPNEYWATVDPLLANRIELVKGPASVLYGSDAIGGTVNQISESALTDGEGWTVDPGFYYRYSSAGDAHVGSFEIQAGDGQRFGVRGGLSLKSYDDLTAGGSLGQQPNTGYDENGGYVKLEYRTSAESHLVISHHRFHQDDVPRTHTTIFARSFHGTTVGSERRRDTDQDRDLTYVQYGSTAPWGFVGSAKFSLSLQRQSEQRDRLKAQGAGGDQQGFDVDTAGLSAQFESDSAIGKLLYGVEVYRDDVDSFSTKFDDAGNVTGVGIQGPIADDARYDLVGVYVQDDLRLSRRLDLNAGLRYTWAAVDAQRVDVGGEETAIVDEWDDLVGNLRLSIGFGPHWRSFVALSQGFRAPGLGDLSKLDDTSAVELPSPDLQPETFMSFEVGAKARHDRLVGQYAYWYTRIDDSIVQSPTGDAIEGTPVVRKDNVGDGYVQGVELAARYLMDGPWMLFGNFTWMEGEVDQLDESADFALVRAPLSRVMPITANLGVRYQKERCWVEGLVTAVDAQDRLALRDRTDTSRIPPGGTPGYAVWTLRGGVHLKTDLDVGVALQNLTDKSYRVHGSGLNEAGFDVVLAVTTRF